MLVKKFCHISHQYESHKLPQNFSHFKSVQILYTCSKFLSLVTLIRTCCRAQCKAAFDSWKDSKYPDDNESHNVYRSKRKDYRSRLRCFLNQVETDKIKKL